MYQLTLNTYGVLRGYPHVLNFPSGGYSGISELYFDTTNKDLVVAATDPLDLVIIDDTHGTAGSAARTVTFTNAFYVVAVLPYEHNVWRVLLKDQRIQYESGSGASASLNIVRLEQVTATTTFIDASTNAAFSIDLPVILNSLISGTVSYPFTPSGIANKIYVTGSMARSTSYILNRVCACMGFVLRFDPINFTHALESHGEPALGTIPLHLLWENPLNVNDATPLEIPASVRVVFPRYTVFAGTGEYPFTYPISLAVAKATGDVSGDISSATGFSVTGWSLPSPLYYSKYKLDDTHKNAGDCQNLALDVAVAYFRQFTQPRKILTYQGFARELVDKDTAGISRVQVTFFGEEIQSKVWTFDPALPMFNQYLGALGAYSGYVAV